MFFDLPIGFSMGLVGFLGVSYIVGFEGALGMLRHIPFSTAASYVMSVIPFFVLMGQFSFFSGMIEDFYYSLHRWLGQLRGGLAMATIGACAGFAAVCGTSLAVSATMTKVALPEMLRYKYDPKLATGSIAAGGTLGILIPPSLAFVVYGIITETSIGKLFIAGILPGILLTTLYCLTIFIITKYRPEMGPPGPKLTWYEKFKSGRKGSEIFLLFVLVMGGIWGGIFTATEGAAIGALGAFIITLAKRRFTKRTLAMSFIDTVRATGMIFSIMIGALIFNFFMALSKLPMALSNFISTLNVPPLVVLLFIILVFTVLGCLMDTLAMALLAVPVVFPTVQAMGFDPIWFGVIQTIMGEVGMITPPIGMNVFVVAGVAKDVPMYTIFRGIIPFLIPLFVCVALLTAFPQIALLLPGIMIGK
jgi:tripartite ATP-independent transporter DctM subunit